MNKLTLLSIINSYLDITSGIRVASLDDSQDSQQIASIAEKVYYDILDDVFNNNLKRNLVQLESLSDSDKPNYLKLPETAVSIQDAKVMYNKSTGLSTSSSLNLVSIPWLSPDDFLVKLGSRSTNQSNTSIITDFSGYKMVIQTNVAASFFTSFDDEHLVFDSYDSSVDTVMQASKSGILTTTSGTFVQSDTYIIDLPIWFHSTYQNAVMAACSEFLREEPLFSIAKAAKLGISKARLKMAIGKKKARRTYGRR